MNDVEKLLRTDRKERSARFDPDEAFLQMFSHTTMAADLLEKTDAHAEQLTREQTAKLASLLRGAAAAAVALDAWKKNNPERNGK